ncbi:MAG: biotin synthase BioB [Gammaproteobacteria bacterium]|nr:biotin synthase BioB [Gammaproteobacteria bacterium]MCH9763823.1 biotin synthase BioB [Gammaproteobacteria bacterium]
MDLQAVSALYTRPFLELLYDAHTVHREHHPKNTIQMAQLLSIKTGACPEDCGYCSQSGHHKTDLKKEKLMCLDDVLSRAKEAKASGATRFCMGAAWRSPPEKSMPELTKMIQTIKAMGLETCMTLGMLSSEQAGTLKAAGLDFYNHNIDTSPSYYEKVTTTRTFSDRLETLQRVRDADIQVCCGGILGIGETREDRIEFLHTLATLTPPPESVPINKLMPVEGAPLGNSPEVEGLELIRTIASARILMPTSKIRLSAGRTNMSDELQAMAFFAGANSVFMGSQLLTTPNPEETKDNILFDKLGLYAEA